MTAASRQLPRSEMPRPMPAPLAEPLERQLAPWAVFALGFFCFIPYPAITLGNSGGFQVGNALSLLMCAPLLVLPWKRNYGLLLLLAAPLLISTIKVGLAGDGELSLSFKEGSVWAISLVALLATQIHAPRYSLELLSGIAAATVIHSAVGLLQMYSFAEGHFPLYRLYVNASFLSVQENAATIAKYNPRPFGIFPEPSAMSASLAPMVTLWVSELCGLIQFVRAPRPWQRALFATAAVGATALIIVSQSGNVIFLIAGLAPIVLRWLSRARATPRTFMVLLFVFGVLLPIGLYFAVDSFTTRLASEHGRNASWEERPHSLQLGFYLFTEGDWIQLLFGVGVGQVAPAMTRLAQIDAVFSVLLNYIYETGIVGLLVLGWIVKWVAGVWRESRFELTFACFCFVWLGGITLATSYFQLLPIWVALGLMMSWPAIFEPASDVDVPRRAAQRLGSRQIDLRWSRPTHARPIFSRSHSHGQ